MAAVGVTAKYTPPLMTTLSSTVQLRPTGAALGYQAGGVKAG